MIRMMAVLLCLVMASPAWSLDVKQVQAQNDIKAWLVEDHTLPVIHVNFTFRDAGAVGDPKDKAGRAQLFADMLMEGTAQYSAEQFHTLLEEKAIYIGVDSDRDTMSVGMKMLSEHREEAFTLLADMMLHPRFDKKVFEKIQKEALVRLKRLQEMPHYIAARAWGSLAYGEHEYSQPRHGDEQTIKALTLEDMKRFHAEFITKANIQVSAVGDVSEKELKSLLDHYLSPMAEQSELKLEVESVSLPEEAKKEHVTRELPQTVLLFGGKGIDRLDPDFYAAYVMNHLVGGGGLTSRLADVIRKQHGLTYDISTALVPREYGQVWYGSFSTKEGQMEKAMKLVHETIEEIVQNGFTQEEVDQAIGYITGSFPLNIDRNASILNYLDMMQLRGLSADYLNQRNDFFHKVTKDQVNEIAKRLLQPGKWIMVSVGASTQ